MKYDFDSVTDRRNSNSLKWDISDGELPMWVADMDFQTAPEILSAIKERAEHGVFGYSVISEAWYAAYMDWWRNRHHFEIGRDWPIFCTGVVPAISSIVRKLTTPAEKVLIQTPVYNIFFNSILNNGRQVLESELLYNDGEYEIDFEDLEQKLADPQTTLMILCNPHNPIGKIWDRETLAQIGALCRKHHVVVLSDEIHCDLTAPGMEYIPFTSVSDECRENSITCIAPTKAFNLAGLQTAAVVVPNPVLRHKVWRALNTDEVAEPNSFAVEATVAAFTKGAPWLDGLRAYLFKNKEIAVDFIQKNNPRLHIVPSQATYLLWIDCSKVADNTSEAVRFIRDTTGLIVSDGAQYGRCGEPFIRMNIACSRVVLEDGLSRLMEGIQKYEEFDLNRC